MRQEDKNINTRIHSPVYYINNSIYQKQMARLAALPADLHQGALLHKNLIRNIQHTQNEAKDIYPLRMLK